MLVFIFWFAVSLIAFTLVGFPLVLLARAKLWPQLVLLEPFMPRISVIIAAYNEEVEIARRIENLLQCTYPENRLEILVASDGSTDDTDAMVMGFKSERVRLFSYRRIGKGQAINQTVPHATGEVLVFSDANTVFAKDALKRLGDPFADPRVGGVAGNQIYTRDGTNSLSADGEKSYWAFDRWLKQVQSSAGNVTSATGAIYAIRTSLFEPTPADSMDDFMISTGVIARGSRLVFEPQAIATEPVATRSKVEWQRKVRVMTQGLRSVVHRRSLLNPFRFGFYSFQLFVHKVLRRVLVVPVLAIAVSSCFLWSTGTIYQVAVIGQVAILLASLIGLCLDKLGRHQSKLFSIPYFFLMVNVAAIVAIWNTIAGRKIQKWQPERHETTSHKELSNAQRSVES